MAQQSISSMLYVAPDSRVATAEAKLRSEGATPDEIRYWWLVESSVRRHMPASRVYPPNATQCKFAVQLAKQDAGSDYRVLPLGARHQKEYAHIAAFMIANIVPKPLAEEQISHLCHHGECVNSEHLIKEGQEGNLDRNKCVGWTWIRCPHGTLFNPCQHTPQCILPQP